MPYKGNMYEFVEKLEAFCKETKCMGEREFSMSLDGYVNGAATLYLSYPSWMYHCTVYDTEDFEQQCYQKVKNLYKEVNR